MRPERLLIDSNLLLLLVVGSTSTGLISTHKRLRDVYDRDDFELLVMLAEDYSGLILTPFTLTETYNLAHQISPPARTAILRTLMLFVDRFPEQILSSRIAVRSNVYGHLGLVDAMLFELTALGYDGQKPVLLTVDLDLAIASEMAGLAVINFNHRRGDV